MREAKNGLAIPTAIMATADEGQNHFFDAADMKAANGPAKHHGDKNVEGGNGASSCIWSQEFARLGKAIERACHDVGKGSDDKEGEEPAEQEEHLAARLANVLFNDLAHALAVVAD